MRIAFVPVPLAVLVAASLAVAVATAQQATVSTPYHTAGHSFYEQIGTHWGIQGDEFSFTFGGANPAVPPFGGFDPNAGLRGGFYGAGGGLSGFFNFAAGQGSRRSFTSQTPSLTLMNGQSGWISDTTLSPFVMGHVPIVGGFPTVGYVNPMMLGPTPYVAAVPYYDYGPPATNPGNHRVQAMLRQLDESTRAASAGVPQAPTAQAATPRRAGGDMNLVGKVTSSPPSAAERSAQRLAATRSSSAGRPVLSVAAARRLHQQDQAVLQKEAASLFERGRAAEDRGSVKMARSLYTSAAKRATGSLLQQVRARLDALGQ